MLTVGIKGRIERIVTPEMTAVALGSGGLPVYGTPCVIELAEETAWSSVEPDLEPGQGTVGTLLQIAHVSATPVGMKVWCETELTAIDRRKLTFSVTVYDEAGLIAEGTHERFIVDNERFMKKTQEKMQ